MKRLTMYCFLLTNYFLRRILSLGKYILNKNLRKELRRDLTTIHSVLSHDTGCSTGGVQAQYMDSGGRAYRSVASTCKYYVVGNPQTNC